MAIEITEKFSVKAPPSMVWDFVMDPHAVVPCLPGAELTEQKDETTYSGQVKVKLGAVNMKYECEVSYESVDEEARTIEIAGSGRETGGGTARGTVLITVTQLEDGSTELATEARVDLTGKAMQMGARMIKGVSAQLFKQFAASATTRLEAAAEAFAQGGDAQAAAAAAVPADEDQALAIAPVIAKTFWQAVVDFFRRLFGGGKARG